MKEKEKGKARAESKASRVEVGGNNNPELAARSPRGELACDRELPTASAVVC